MVTVTIQEAQAKLADLIHNLTPDDELLITENNQPVAKLISQSTEPTHKLPEDCSRSRKTSGRSDKNRSLATPATLAREPNGSLCVGSTASRKSRQRGSAKGKLVIHAEDDEHLEHFKEYMP